MGRSGRCKRLEACTLPDGSQRERRGSHPFLSKRLQGEKVPSSAKAITDAAKGQIRTNIKMHRNRRIGVWRVHSSIKVQDVTLFCAAPIDDPIMSVKGLVIAHK